MKSMVAGLGCVRVLGSWALQSPGAELIYVNSILLTVQCRHVCSVVCYGLDTFDDAVMLCHHPRFRDSLTPSCAPKPDLGCFLT